jgi:hypothetical protein
MQTTHLLVASSANTWTSEIEHTNVMIARDLQVTRLLVAANADIHAKTMPAMQGPAQRSPLHEVYHPSPPLSLWQAHASSYILTAERWQAAFHGHAQVGHVHTFHIIVSGAAVRVWKQKLCDVLRCMLKCRWHHC